MNQSLSKPEPDSQKMVSRRRSSFSGSLPLLCPLPPNEPVSNTPAAEHRTKPSAVGLLSTADGQQRESSGTEISFDADEPSSQALAAQLARLETQQAFVHDSTRVHSSACSFMRVHLYVIHADARRPIPCADTHTCGFWAQAQMTEQMASLQTGMETLLRRTHNHVICVYVYMYVCVCACVMSLARLVAR